MKITQTLSSALLLSLLARVYAETDCAVSPLSLAWRHNLPSGTASTPLVTRDPLTGDTRIIVTTTHGYITVLDESGHVLSGFPIHLSDRIYADPILMDMDGDSIDDIVIVDGNGVVFAIPMVALAGTGKMWKWDGFRIPGLEVDRDWYNQGFEVPIHVASGSDEVPGKNGDIPGEGISGNDDNNVGRKPIIGDATGSVPLTRVGKKKVWDGKALLGAKLAGKRTKMLFGKNGFGKNRKSGMRTLRYRKKGKKAKKWRKALLSKQASGKKYGMKKYSQSSRKIRVLGLRKSGKGNYLSPKQNPGLVAGKVQNKKSMRSNLKKRLSTKVQKQPQTPSQLTETATNGNQNSPTVTPADRGEKLMVDGTTSRKPLSVDLDDVFAWLDEEETGTSTGTGTGISMTNAQRKRKNKRQMKRKRKNTKISGKESRKTEVLPEAGVLGRDSTHPTTIKDKKITIPAHIVATPVVYDCDGDGIMDLILPVSYHFDKKSHIPRDVDPNNYVSSGIVVYSPKNGIIWSKSAELTTAYTHTRAMIMLSPIITTFSVGISGAKDNLGVNEPYIVFSTSMGYTHAWALRSGESLPSQFPIITNSVTSLTVVDMDNDGNSEILIGNSQGKIFLYDRFGKLRLKFPTLLFRKRLGVEDTSSRASVLVSVGTGDVNGDGYVDVVATARDGVIWAFNGAIIREMLLEGSEMKENARNRELMGSLLTGFPHYLGADVKKGIVMANLDMWTPPSLLRAASKSIGALTTGIGTHTGTAGAGVGTASIGSEGNSEDAGGIDGAAHIRDLLDVRVGERVKRRAGNTGTGTGAGKGSEYGVGLHIIGADEDGRVFAVDGRNGCLQEVNIGEGVRGMVSLAQLGANKHVKIVVATEQGSILSVSTSSLYSPAKAQRTRPEGQWTAYVVAEGEGRRGSGDIDQGGNGKIHVRGKQVAVAVQINDVRATTTQWLTTATESAVVPKIPIPKYYITLRICAPVPPPSTGEVALPSSIVRSPSSSPSHTSFVRLVVQQPGRHVVTIAAPTVAWESSLCLRVENEAGDVVTDIVGAVWNEDFYVMMKLMIMGPIVMLSGVLLYTRMYNEE